jgi:pullulanase/glycogen debranching enzyme
MCARRRNVEESRDETEPTAAPWYKDAIIYELYVRSFFDSNGEGSAISPG